MTDKSEYKPNKMFSFYFNPMGFFFWCVSFYVILEEFTV